ncbi:ABC transporter substrate-binding protein [Nakamurella lactea]|uniref:ABC transporter substrate-binding protein n=1 Tax=Nakamurella lactea TaxID=459515 RepID=UPI00040FE368|nr:ABC transporter substrate-binding protein [Nakamurella lactea]
MRKYGRFKALIACAVTALVAVGCGSMNESNSSGGGAAAADDTFVVGMSADPPHLIRLFLGDVQVGLVGLAMEESLVTVSRDKKIEPQLATSWEMKNPTTYVFHLREGVTWHDGKPFTADDVVYTFENGLGINSGTASLKDMIKSSKAVDESTVEVSLKSPSGAFLAMLNPMSFTILPKHIYDGTDLEENPANRAPVGTGPFKFESWESNRITLVRNDNYWGDKPKYAKVVFTVLGDPTARALALKKGDIDYINSYDVTFEAIKQLDEDPNVKLDIGRASISMKMFPFNTRNEILAKPEVRHALFQAINRDFISKSVFGGYFPPGHAPLPDGHWANSGEVDFDKLYPYDPKAAEAALDAAGYPKQANGIRFSLTHRYEASEPGGEKVAEVIADNWKAIGVETKVVQDDAEVFRQEVFSKHNFDTYTINIASGADPAIGLYRRYTCDNDQNAVFGNATGYCNKSLDELFLKANSANEQAERTPLYTEAQKVIAEDLPTSILVQVKYTEAIRANLTGIEGFFHPGEVVLLDWSKIGPPAA